MLAMIMIIDNSGCVKLNNVSPRTQSFINIFAYFCFSLFSTNPNLPALLKVKANTVAKLLCSLLPHISMEGKIL